MKATKGEPAAEPEAGPGDGGGSTPAGAARRGQTLRLTLDAWRQLKHLSVDEGKTSHDLLLEAVNMLFRDRGLPPIA